LLIYSQVTSKAMSYSLNLRQPSTYQLEQYTTRSQHLRQFLITERLLLGEYDHALDTYSESELSRYLNGSILVATLQPFTMVHSLNTSNAPSRVTGLAWHGSATRQKSDMLATQTADGNIRVWSIPKIPNGDPPNIIRILNRPDGSEIGPCWFGWSKLGRIVQHAGG